MTEWHEGPVEPFDHDDVRARAHVLMSSTRPRHVSIDRGRLAAFATTFAPAPPPPMPEERLPGPPEAVVAEVLAWNAVNFGSGWFPHLRKRDGMSGARTLAHAWHARCEDAGPPTARELADAAPAAVGALFGQESDGPAGELMTLFAAAWRELGSHLLEHHAGSAAECVRSARGRAGALVRELGSLPMWHDVHDHPGRPALRVVLLKRAQIVVSHLASALPDHPLGRFDDLDRLTAFADNLVPHVLRLEGVLVVDPDVVARIDAGDLFTSGEPAEVELRVAAVVAVDELASLAGTTPASVDHQLWRRGQSPGYKAFPRHRCRCTFY